MWAFMPWGVIMPAAIPEKYRKKDDPRTMQLRSRRSQDLDILRALYMQGTLGATIHTPDKDYEYRAYCKPEDFAWAMFEFITQISYSKFKPEILNFADHAHHSLCNSIWSTYITKISTKKHQDEYWGKWDKDRDYDWPEDRDRDNDGAWPEDRRYTGTGYFSRSRDATFRGNAGAHRQGPAAPYELPAGTNGIVTGPHPDIDALYPQHRGSAADRDDYTPDVWDEEEIARLKAESDRRVGMVDDEVDEVINAYDRIARILAEDEEHANEEYQPRLRDMVGADLDDDTVEVRINHATCDHGQSESAKRRCLRRRRRKGLHVQEA